MHATMRCDPRAEAGRDMMLGTLRIVCLASALGLAAVNLAMAQDDATILQVREESGNWRVGVPVSKLELVIAKGSLQPKALKGTPGNPRYFQFVDATSGTIASGWFESADHFTSVDKLWKQTTDSWKQHGLPDPRNVSFQKVGGWDAIFYDIDIPDATNTHVEAHLVRAGTWIDIHLSMTNRKTAAENRTGLKSMLQSIVVNERP